MLFSNIDTDDLLLFKNFVKSADTKISKPMLKLFIESKNLEFQKRLLELLVLVTLKLQISELDFFHQMLNRKLYGKHSKYILEIIEKNNNTLSISFLLNEAYSNQDTKKEFLKSLNKVFDRL
jgi:hypothetical protein